MIKGLYDEIAKRWYHGGTVWFYSDPHFADEEMRHLRKNYVGDDEQVKLINSKIGKKDTIVILGDIGDKEYLKKIRGYKVLVLGNHDAGASTFDEYADEIYEGPLMIAEKLIISHEEVDVPFAVNIHGHTHGGSRIGIDVCAEHIGYIPVPIKSIIESGILKSKESIHRATIDMATDRARKRGYRFKDGK